ncbi:hypothetical protein ACE193_00015 [Bernardetia sp. OM2101]|uniref:hypothetical protein n=1 Tax=Bernardetia sp. OM2101 TaxID=3344876 RepID=UPI0035D05CBD
MKNIFKRFYSLFLVATLAILLTSCFDLKEEITINKDGSGSFIQTIDMGSNPMIQMALNMQSDSAKNANKDMNKMDSTMEETKVKLSKIKGISNIKTASSTEELKYTIMYDFADIDALNRAINTAEKNKEGEEKGELKVMKKLYSFKKGQLTKANLFSMGDSGMDMSELMGDKKENGTEQTEEEKAQMKQMLQMFFGNANYTYIVHVPNKVKSYSNKKNTTVSEDGKTLTMTIPFMELLQEDKKANVGNSVKFK